MGWEDVLDHEITKLMGPDALQSGKSVTTSAERADSVADFSMATPGESTTLSFAELRERVAACIKRGSGLSEDVCDEDGKVLLLAGSPITKQFLQLLRGRGLTRVHLCPPSARAKTETLSVDDFSPELLHTARSRALDKRLAGELLTPVIFNSVRGWRRPRLAVDDLKEQADRGIKKHLVSSRAIGDVSEALCHGRTISLSTIRDSVSRFVDMASNDFDLLPLIVAMQKSSDEYLFDHCVNVAMLSMSIASQLGLDRDMVTQIGLGGMLHDIGMLRVPLSIRQARRTLDEREWFEVHRHPLHTLDMLGDIRGLPQTVRLIAYQTHERADGGGYPRRRTAEQLHPFAKIVSIADSYAAMTRARPYRGPLGPYVAVKTLLDAGAADQFDRVLVRAFLDTVSLFPIGSNVGLSNGSKARVLRANPGLHTRPIVEVLSADNTPTGCIVDLSDEEAPKVITAA